MTAATAPAVGSGGVRIVLLACLTTLATAGAAEARTWTVGAPGGGLEAEVRTAADGGATVRVLRRGAVVLTAGAGRLPGRVRARRAAVDQRFRTPAGKRREHRLRARRLVLDGAGRRRLELLAAGDGVALRLRGAGSPEPTTFRAPGGTEAWLQDYTAGYEDPYVRRRLDRAPRRSYGFPALLRDRRGTATLLTEAGGDRASHLELTRGRKAGRAAADAARATALRVALPSGTRSAGQTAWRVAVVGTLADVVASDLPLALGAPSRIADTSWIRPGRVAWSWWADSFSTFSPPRLRDYADLAQRQGWEYQTVDARWRREQLPGIVADGAARGVRSLLWFDADDLDTPTERDRVLDDVARLGFAGVKVDYLLSDRPSRIRLYAQLAQAAAKRRLVVAFHGSTVPRGLERTWPNVLAYEAVRGAEYARNDELGPDAAQAVALVFTRNPIGPMDYTPVTFSARNRTTTDGHELAKAVAFQSGLQHYADTPEAYAARPAAAAVLRDVPAAWDDTRLVAGSPSTYAAVARRDGATWWIGALNGATARDAVLPLSFLPAGRTFTATTTGDDLSVTSRTVTRETVLRIPLAREGGATVRLSG